MSKGISKIQKCILDVLGNKSLQVFAAGSGELTTSELREELLAHELLRDGGNRKSQMASVIRACGSLQRRNLVGGVYRWDDDNPGRYTVVWKLSAIADNS